MSLDQFILRSAAAATARGIREYRDLHTELNMQKCHNRLLEVMGLFLPDLSNLTPRGRGF